MLLLLLCCGTKWWCCKLWTASTLTFSLKIATMRHHSRRLYANNAEWRHVLVRRTQTGLSLSALKRPCIEKRCLYAFIVCSVIVCDIAITSAHFGVCVNHDRKRLIQERASEINVKVLAWVTRPTPQMQRCLCWSLLYDCNVDSRTCLGYNLDSLLHADSLL